MSSLTRAWRSLQEAGDATALQRLSSAVGDLRALAQAAHHRRLAGLAGAVESMLEPAIAAGDRARPELLESLEERLNIIVMLARALPQAGTRGADLDGESILVLEQDGSVSHGEWRQAAHFNYHLRSAPDVPAVLERLAAEPVRAVILDLDCLPGGMLDTGLVDALYGAAGRELPLIATSRYDDMRRRLAAARAGVRVYLPKPLDPIDLIDQLDEAVLARSEREFRIVLVDDSPGELAYHTSILERAGMRVTGLTDPMRALDVLAEHTVDLIVLDMYMPACNGRDLALVIRQMPEHAGIPIVFFAAEIAAERRLDAMSLGADDFLIKPIDPSHLIRAVRIRAERARTLRALMVTDHLTGLLNQTRVKEQLKNELAAAERRGSKVAFAMIDIDQFKAVNDSHGHPVGDRVIKTLARILRQRLRRTDIIGRYGGEEFAVIMPDTSVHEALPVIDNVREEFARIVHTVGDSGFSVTFSGGIAAYPETTDVAGLAVRADDALYAAKQAGRNRVMVAIA